MTYPINHHLHYVCSHCACALPRDLYVGANIFNTLKIYDPICLLTLELMHYGTDVGQK